MVEPRKWLFLVIAFAFFHGLLYAFIVPPWQAPDEDAHFFSSYMVAYTGRLPERKDVPDHLPPAIAESILEYNYMFLRGRLFNTRGNDYSSLLRTIERYSPAYILYGIAITPFLNHDFVFQLYVMRLVSVIINVAIIVVTFLGIRKWRPKSPSLAFGASVFITLWPQHAFIASSVNDGNLAELFTTLTFYFGISVLIDGPNLRSFVLVAASLFMAFVSKNTTYFLAPLLGIILFDSLLRFDVFKKTSSHMFIKFGLGLLVVSIVALLSFRIGLLQLLLQSQNQQEIPIGRVLSGSFASLLWTLFRSFWVALGWMIAYLPNTFYGILAILLLLALVGWLLWGRGKIALEGRISIIHVFELAFLLNILMLMIWILFFEKGFDYIQGRFLFATSFPFSIILTMMWFGLFPVSLQRFGFQSWVFIWLSIDAMALMYLAITYFYQLPFKISGG